jgi:N-acetylglucosamine-6-sulfatase
MSVASRAVRSVIQATRQLVGETPSGAIASAAQVDVRPNFVVVVTDDMRDSDWQALPQTREWLAGSGTTFPNFILTTPLCAPSRTSLFTGMYTHNHGVTHNDGKDGGYAQFKQAGLDERTIVSALRDTGYRTGIFGKFLNGVASEGKIPGGWDEWLVTTDRDYYHAGLNDNGKAKTLSKRSDYETDVLATRASEFIQATPATTPFLLWFTPRAPHGKLQPRKQDRGRYNGVRRQRSPDVDGYDNSDKPAHIRDQSPPSLGTLDSIERQRLDMLVATDDAIVSVLTAVQDAGRLANTVVFVLSDNGYMMGSHGCDDKMYPYQEATRVAMLGSGPPFAVGVTDQRVTGNIDIAPTIAALAGVSLPGADGVPIFERTPQSELLVEDSGGDKGYAGLRTVDRLYVEYGTGERELYDYRRDPYELDNLLADWNGYTPTGAAKKMGARFAARLQTLRTCAGATCR